MGIARALSGLAAVIGVTAAGVQPAAALPPGFSVETVVSNLRTPTAMAVAPDGRIFIAEKGGAIKVLDGVGDTTPETVIDMRRNVHNFYDRGLLNIVLAPDFLADPAVYAAYSHDAEIGGTAPRWGTASSLYDGCPTPPGPTDDGCIGSGRIVRIALNGNVAAGPERVLVEDYCQQYPSHSVGGLAFDAAGRLYASAGDAASYGFLDYGQDGDPVNPCGDPPGGVGGPMSPPTAEGGSLRSQDLWTPTADPVGLDGTVIRVDPLTGEGVPGNPRFGSNDPNTRRIVAYGLRQPFRMAIRPGSDEVWLAEVGQSSFEEINRFTPSAATPNFGWPCYEGADRKRGWDAADFTICEGLYGSGQHVPPVFGYDHDVPLTAGENCPDNGSSVTGLAFGESSTFPEPYRSALFFSDYSKSCMWTVAIGPDGTPDPTTLALFSDGINPVDLEFGADGSLYYVDIARNSIRRISYDAVNSPPTAVAVADPMHGDPPLTVNFDGSGSTDPDQGDELSWAWDLDDDGEFDDATTATASHTYTEPGEHRARLRVTDPAGASGIAALTISVGNGPPVPVIVSPSPGLRWSVGDRIAISGGASDREDGELAPSQLRWEIDLRHCSGGCHNHELDVLEGVAEATLDAPDHEYPSELELTLIATDSAGAQAETSVTIAAEWTRIIMAARRVGIPVGLNGTVETTPFVTKVIPGSLNTILAPTPQVFEGHDWEFRRWEHGGERVQTVIAPPTDSKYIARYRDLGPSAPPPPPPGENGPPSVTIESPGPGAEPWQTGEQIAFAASAEDAEDGTLPGSAIDWRIELQHCTPVCSRSPVRTLDGAAAATVAGPDDPAYPADLVFTATATDSGGLSASAEATLAADSIEVIMAARRVGIPVELNGRTETTPFVTRVVPGSTNAIAAPTPQTYDGLRWDWRRWEHGGDRVQDIVVPAAGSNAKFVARYRSSEISAARAGARERSGERAERKRKCKRKRGQARKRCRRARR